MRKNSGFTLIEVVVVLAIVGVLTSFFAPKARNYIAVAKDTSAINTLGVLRTAMEMHYISKNEILKEGDLTEDQLMLLKEYLPENIISKLHSGDEGGTGTIYVGIGGSKESQDEKIAYGGKIGIEINGDGELKFKTSEGIGSLNTNGEKWNDF